MGTPPEFPDITGIILGGGQSLRMGRDKRYLQWEGQPFLDRVCRLMSSLFDEILVVMAQNDYDCSHLPVRVVTDKIPKKGSLGGLYTGLIESKNPLAFVVACDMPFLTTPSIGRLCKEAYSDVLAVEISNRIQPLHARYSKQCCTVIEKMIQNDDLKIQNLLVEPDLAVKVLDESLFDDIDPSRFSFLNINTPADLEFARKRFSQNSLS